MRLPRSACRNGPSNSGAKYQGLRMAIWRCYGRRHPNSGRIVTIENSGELFLMVSGKTRKTSHGKNQNKVQRLGRPVRLMKCKAGSMIGRKEYLQIAAAVGLTAILLWLQWLVFGT